MQKILIVFGTRPEAIKMAPLISTFKGLTDEFETKVCITAQHRQMLDQVLTFFEVIPDYDLNLMRPDQNLYQLTSSVLLGMKTVLDSFKPDYVFVHGDTTTSTTAALAAFYAQCKVCHVEAGLRTYNKYAPFPEEMNRQLTGRIADWHFAPTEKARTNLLNEGIRDQTIFVTGNTVIDALLIAKDKLTGFEDEEIKYLSEILDPTKKVILVTGHRRENFGDGFLNICHAIKEIAQIHQDKIQVIYPVHLNPKVQEPVFNILNNCVNIKLIQPLGYPAFVWLMARSHIILTDSGGVQEEAPSLGKPVLVMREITERPEAVDAGTVRLVGTDKNKIVSNIEELLSGDTVYKQMSLSHNPYGDGYACGRMINALRNLSDR
jgi:UDP-N-acetylglucosamine 2-epimerase (non-hydrolysing)